MLLNMMIPINNSPKSSYLFASEQYDTMFLFLASLSFRKQKIFTFKKLESFISLKKFLKSG